MAPTTRRRRSSSRRRHEDDDGFKITQNKLGWALGIAALVGSGFGGWSYVRDFWTTTDKFKAHQKLDINVRDWTTYGLSNNRLEYLKDKVYECEQKRAAGEMGKKSDVAICAHYDSRVTSTQAEADKLKEKALDGNREKAE